MGLYRHFEIPLPPHAHHIKIMSELDVSAFSKVKSIRALSRNAGTGAAASSSSLLEDTTLFSTKQAFNTLDANLLYSLTLQNQQALIDVVRDLQEDVRSTPPDPSLMADDDKDEDNESDDDAEDDEDISGSDTDDDEEIPISTVLFAGDDPDA
ncbi:uncharacterized protein LOC132316461 [Cornus florida]|uniref:uncharacterized protein LOC132316461 n=1 Tax=Cornus florida TaxID=4283 RepID=UPI002896F08E|nr:uncharacterized protein LOC132316461 [Cornus florida]